MKEQIKEHLDHPEYLEALYQKDKKTFRKEFNLIYDEIRDLQVAKVWNARLNFEKKEILWGTTNEWIFVGIASIFAAFLVKLPDIASLNSDSYFLRNAGFVIFPSLTSYFIWKQKAGVKKIAGIFAVFLASVLYINLLPGNDQTDTLILACIHTPLFLWAVLGFSFLGTEYNNHQKRLNFLSYNGDLIVMTTLIIVAGGLFTVITLGLFNLIELDIEDFYFRYIALPGLAASPIFGTYLVHNNPNLVNKISPVIARIFTPIVLVTLTLYLIAVIYTNKSPYNDREFLLIFNILLIAVMAIILFSIAENSEHTAHKLNTLMLLGLSAVTVILNVIALSAILLRITEWGITPNRMAILGANILILSNLLMVSFSFLKVLTSQAEFEKVERCITKFLPVYIIWIIIVVFGFPIMFGFQ